MICSWNEVTGGMKRLTYDVLVAAVRLRVWIGSPLAASRVACSSLVPSTSAGASIRRMSSSPVKNRLGVPLAMIKIIILDPN